MKKSSKSDRQSKIRKIGAGMSKFYGNLKSFKLGGTTFTPAELAQLLESDIAACDAADQARAAWLKAVEAQKAANAETNPVLRAIRNKVLGDHGDTRDAGELLAVFGFSPRTTRKRTGAENVEAANKREATRKARHTLGKKQREQIRATTDGSSVATPPAVPSQGTP